MMKELGTKKEKGFGFRSWLAGGIAFGLGLLGAQAEENSMASMREWKSKNGKFSVTASFDSYDAASRKVTLKKEDSTSIQVPLLKLSAADQSFVKEQAGQSKSGGKPIKLYGIQWQPKMEEALSEAAGQSAPSDDRPVMWFRVLGQLDDGM